MAVDAESFKVGMRRLGGAVTIIATECDGSRFGLTATAVCSLSAEPPRLLCCVNRRGMSFRAIADSGRFSVNLLNDGQQAIAMRFAGMAKGDHADRFAGLSWRELHTGAPALLDAIASFDCAVSQIVDAGSHGIVIGDVMAVHLGETTGPLFYLDGQFSAAARLFA